MLTLASPIGAAPPIRLVPEKVTPAVADRQDCQSADRVRLGGWIGARMDANATNRMAAIDPDRLLEGYRHRPGRQTWDGEHIGKWLHAATLAWANTGDPVIRKKLDYVAVELAKCQMEDGYLGTYAQSERWTMWDVWAHKYNLIGLVTYMRYTGNLAPMPTCRRMADLLCGTFGDEPGKRDLNLAGQHLGMAPTSVLEPMILLYRLTGESRYLDFCKYILRAWEKPNGAKVVSTLLNEKRVDRVGNGKAYEMLSCLNGALEYYRTTGERPLFEACLNAWEDIVKHRLYLTGTASYREFFRDDYDLPNVNNVGETCVTVTWLQFNAQLLRLTGEARFAEQLEKVVLNQLFGAQCPDGSAWGYYVQMEGKKPYSGSLDGHCCLSSGPRGVSLISTFALSTDADGVVVNLYETGSARLTLRDGAAVALASQTMYPADGRIRISVRPETVKTFTVKLRIPEWCPNPEVRVNGTKLAPARGGDGYAWIRREWKRGDQIHLRLALEPRLVTGQRQNEGRIAILYGPLVLAADEALLGDSQEPLSHLGVSQCDLNAIKFKAEAAPGDFKTWPGAQVFRIRAVSRPTPESKAAKPLTAKLLPFADAGATGTRYKIWLPCQPARPDRNLLRDGVEIRSRKPNTGSILDGNVQTIAATFNNRSAELDWFGVELEEPVLISRLVFTHGKSYHDGGWFDASRGKPRIEVQTTAGGPWNIIGTLDDYPATTAADPAGLKDSQSFVHRWPQPLRVFGARVAGKPASGDKPRQAFSTCAELGAFLN